MTIFPPPKAIDYLMKTSTPDIRKPLFVLSCWSDQGCLRDSLTHTPNTGYCYCPWLSPKDWSSYCWGHNVLQTHNPEDYSWFRPESLLPDNYLSRYQKAPSSFQGRKETNSSSQLWCLWNWNSDQCGIPW